MLAFAMPAGFTRTEVEAIASLAQLELEPHEIELFAEQLGNILDYVNQLQQVDTAGVPPTAAVATGHDADRPDQLAASLPRADALANAPEPALAAGLFKVPRVIG
jgi:aspartyl-tRNA(Asn)/glutamyl-tRNA(Gln) amidotransferase subunit C